MKKLRVDEMNRVDIDTFKSLDKVPIVMVLDDIRSLHNVGSVFRTADAFALKGIYLCGITAQPPHREIQKTALGATESVDWLYFEKTEDAIEDLKQKGFHVMAIEQAHGSEKLDTYQYSFEKPLALVLGNEVKGVNSEVMKCVDGCIEIPQFGTKHSLNVSISAGILIWEMFRQYQLSEPK
jgi:tRNA G18 (ribose-2'-O)-methylase SpoU